MFNKRLSDSEIGDIAVSISKALEERKYRPAVLAIIRNSRGHILFVQSAKNLSEWYLPQGGIEQNETFVSALHRELFEELGIVSAAVEIEHYKGSHDLDAEIERKDRRMFSRGKRYFAFTLRYNGPDDLRFNSDEIASFCWAAPECAARVLETSRPEKKYLLLKFLDG